MRSSTSISIPGLSGIHPGTTTTCLILPPGEAIIPKQYMGEQLYLFAVVACQKKSLRLAIVDPAQHYFLSRGDTFHVPQGNMYELQNHSESSPCVLSVTVVYNTAPNHATEPDEEPIDAELHSDSEEGTEGPSEKLP